MSFASLTYLVFLPVVALVYRLLPQKARPVWLLLASLVFYASWNVPLTLLLVAVIAITYAAGLGLARVQKPGQRRWLLGLSLALCLGALLYFKYFGFLAGLAARAWAAFGGNGTWRLWDVILPVGISFYTFQALSYVFDVYRGRLDAERNPIHYALYISFFPQLVAGPIERAGDLLPQLRTAQNPTAEDVHFGLRLLLSGYFKKIVLADFCGRFVERIYGAPSPDGSAVLLGTLLFAVQIYGDFAGYSEIARGSAALVGVRLMQNFDRPYLADNLRDFWRRWHISLTKWLTDYVYIPLGGSQNGLLRQIAATLCVFLLSGLWHGANETFVVWGLLHGLGVVCVLLYARAKLPWPKGRAGKWLGVALTFSYVTLLWIFFRAETLSQATGLFGSLFSAWDISAGLALLGMTWEDALRLMLSLCAMPLCHGLIEREQPPITFAFWLLTIAWAWSIRLAEHAANAFIYFQF